MKEDHCWSKSDLNQTNIFIEIRPKSDLNVTKIDRNQTMAWDGLKTRFETKLCPSWWSQIICVHSSQDKFWRWYVHRFTNYTQLYHGLEAILHYGQVDVDSSLQNRTFERKIGPFSDQFAPKSPIADQSPRKSDLVGTLALYLHCKHNREGRTDRLTEHGYIMSTVPSLPQVPRSTLSNDGIYALIEIETYLQVSVYRVPVPLYSCRNSEEAEWSQMCNLMIGFLWRKSTPRALCSYRLAP